MHPIAPLIQDLAVILGLAGLVALVFQKIKQPVVLGYLIAGIIVGPYTPPYLLVNDIPNIHILSELGVIFLMFSLGLEFSFQKLMRVGFSAVFTGTIEIFLMMLVGTSIGLSIGWSFNQSIFLGAALAISSTTIIIKALEELKLKHLNFAELIFGILVIEDLIAILILVGLSMTVTTQTVLSWSMLLALIKLIMVVGGWFLTGYFLVPLLFNRITPYVSDETLTLVSIALCLGLVVMAGHFHYSSALGAFIMGSILSETLLAHRIEKLVEPIRNLFAAVFFVSIGMLIDPKVIIAHYPLVLLLSAVTIIGKLLTTGLGALLSGQSFNTSVRVGLGMAQIGEFSFIIAGLALTLNISNPTLYPVIVAVSAITTFTTPYCIRWSEPVASWLETLLPTHVKNKLLTYSARLNHSKTSPHPHWYGKALFQLGINATIIAIVFNVTAHGLAPLIIDWIELPTVINTGCWVMAALLTLPFMIGMILAFKNKFPSGPEHRLITLPFTVLSALLWFAELVILSHLYFDDTWVIVLLLGVMSLIMLTCYRPLNAYYARLETHLKRNLKL